MHYFVLQKIKYKVKFDKGARGLLSSNHISLETNPNASVLNVGSRVVGRFKGSCFLYIQLKFQVRVLNGQEKVNEGKIISRSGKSPGIYLILTYFREY